MGRDTRIRNPSPATQSSRFTCVIFHQIIWARVLGMQFPRPINLVIFPLLLPKFMVLPRKLTRRVTALRAEDNGVAVPDIPIHPVVVPHVDEVGLTPHFHGGGIFCVRAEPYEVYMHLCLFK
jgi:hypothetical protein